MILLAPLIGRYLFQAFTDDETTDDETRFERLLNPLERQIYRWSGVDSEENMSAQDYAIAVVVSNTAMAIFAFLLLLCQG